MKDINCASQNIDFMTEEDERLIPFLRNLADSIEKRQLLPRQLLSIGEFFMSYQFQEQAIKDNDNSSQPLRFNNEDLLKFITMGWFVYCVILKGETLNFADDSDQSDHLD